jgi:hypothetical protein
MNEISKASSKGYGLGYSEDEEGAKASSIEHGLGYLANLIETWKTHRNHKNFIVSHRSVIGI